MTEIEKVSQKEKRISLVNGGPGKLTKDDTINEKPTPINTQKQPSIDVSKPSSPEIMEIGGNPTTTTVARANMNSPPISPQNPHPVTWTNTNTDPTPVPEHDADSDDNNNNNNDNKNATCTSFVSPTAAPSVHPMVAQLKAQLYQQQQILNHLEVERSQYKIDIQSLNDRLGQMNTKIQQRSEAQQQLEINYHEHLQSMRATSDDLDSISMKLKQLKAKIRTLADELLEHVDPMTATHALRTFWLNLSDCIKDMGKPLPLHRVRLLTEKFMMDVLVQNMNLNVFPGVAVSEQYNDLSFWLEKYDATFSTRLRQEMALVLVKQNIAGNDIHKKLHEAVQANWKFLYGGLIKAYPFMYHFDKHEPDTQKHYGAKVQVLVEHAMALGIAMKGQEVDVAAAETRERAQPFDAALMVDEDGQSSGIVDFCICPPFVVYGPKVYTLEKGRVLCSPMPSNNRKNGGKDAHSLDLPAPPVST